jgi:hypothetical protein
MTDNPHDKAFSLKEEFLNVFSFHIKNSRFNREQIGDKALAAVLRKLVDLCETIPIETCEELYIIAEELENFKYPEK